MTSKRSVRIGLSAALAIMALVLGFVGSASAARSDSTAVNDATVIDAGALERELFGSPPLYPAKLDDTEFANLLRIGVNADQAVFDDLVVEDGEVIDGGVVVYDGDARVKSGGRIDGDLVVYSGDIVVESDGVVDGNVSAFAGDIRVSGRVAGNVTAWSGDINLRDESSVGGDVSVLAGDVRRASGAAVDGTVVRGPRLDIPAPAVPFSFGDAAGGRTNAVSAAGSSALHKFTSFVFRLIGMAMLSLLVGVIVWLIAQIRPSAIRNAQATMAEQPALSFVVGVLANVVVLVAGGFVAITVCLLPLTILSYLVLFGLNVLGWAALSNTVGQRLTTRYDLTMRWDYMAGLTGAVMAAVFGLFWAMGGCFRFFGFAGMLVAASVGAGAVLLPLANRLMHPPAGQLPEKSSAATEEPPVASGVSAAVSGAGESQTGDGEAEVPEASGVSAPSETALQSQDDLLQLEGIGPVSADRLREAGVSSFLVLAQLTPERLGEILHWSPERVSRSGIIEQAAGLASAD